MVGSGGVTDSTVENLEYIWMFFESAAICVNVVIWRVIKKDETSEELMAFHTSHIVLPVALNHLELPCRSVGGSWIGRQYFFH